MAISILSSTIDGDSATTVTTDAIDTTGASAIVVFVIIYGSTLSSISDSQGNTWTASTAYTSANTIIRAFYKAAPSTSASHTFTFTFGANVYPCIAVAVLSGTHATPYDSVAGDDDGTPGPLTPTENNCIVLAFCDKSQAGTATISDGFTKLQELELSSGNYYGGLLAYKLQTIADSANPTISGLLVQTSILIAFRAAVEAPSLLYSMRGSKLDVGSRLSGIVGQRRSTHIGR